MTKIKYTSIPLAFILLFLGSCYHDGLVGISGSGPIVVNDINMAEFSEIDLQINGNVYLTYGSEQIVSIEGQQNIIDNIEYHVVRDKWYIDFDRRVREHEGLNIYITTPYIDEIEISGSGNITGNSVFDAASMELKISGSGNIYLDVVSDYLYTNISGSGNIELLGMTEKANLHISGSGRVDAFELRTEECDINISGSGNSYVMVSDRLEANISGSGNVFYIGSPRIYSNVSGSGNIYSSN